MIRLAVYVLPIVQRIRPHDELIPLCETIVLGAIFQCLRKIVLQPRGLDASKAGKDDAFGMNSSSADCVECVASVSAPSA